MIFKGSRYENVPVVTVTTSNGMTTKALALRVIPPTPAGYRHTFVAGERLDLLAYAYYQDAQRFWPIADANTDMDAADLEDPGRAILVPPDPS